MLETGKTARKSAVLVISGSLGVLFTFISFFIMSNCFIIGLSVNNAAAAEPLKSRRDMPRRWDPNRYIDIWDIKAGDEAYCLTDYGDNGIEKFPMVVVDVVYDFEPDRDIILVKGLDERFIHSGPVAGCSGSPLYINGKLAGALALGWELSKDPLYGVTPIREMLMVGQRSDENTDTTTVRRSLAIDYSKPINFKQIREQIKSANTRSADSISPATYLPCPIMISGVSSEVVERISNSLSSLGFMAVPTLSGSVDDTEEIKFEPGAPLTIPLVSGDIKMEVLGTVTEIVDDKVYAFGHDFQGYGPIDLPMAGGKVYTVVSTLSRSFKLGAAADIIGSIKYDESTSVYGKIGAVTKLIPVKIRVDRFNDSSVREYNCKMAFEQSLTPSILLSMVSAAVLQKGELPVDHTIEYSAKIKLADENVIEFNNTSTTADITELATEALGALTLLVDNPFKKADLQSVEFDVKVTPKNLNAAIWSVQLSDATPKPGQTIDIDVVVETYQSQKRKYQLALTVPPNLAPGRYEIMVSGVYEYEKFLEKAVPYRYTAYDYSSLIEALNDALAIKRNRLYCLLVMPAGGVAIERAELPDLPASKTLVLQDSSRALNVMPIIHWKQASVNINAVITNKEVLRITVEK